MVSDLTVQEIHDFISKDFVGAWDSMALNSDKNIGRGNFMFARQAMNLLEFACRLYGSNSKIRTQFSTELKKTEPRYFARLPSPCADLKEFTLPHLRNKSGDLLLWALFDLIRNGLAHQYQQITVKLKGRRKFFIELTGAKEGRHLDTVRKSRHASHLDYFIDKDGDIGVRIYPDQLFLDIEQAIQQSRLLSKNLKFKYLKRPIGKKRRRAKNKQGKKFYSFNVRSLERSLVNGGHSKI